MKRTHRKAAAWAIALALAISVAACGSGEDTTTTVQPPPVSAATADHLAKLSNRIASDLEAGETCSAAIAADELKSAVEEADLSATLRPEVETVATDLVNQVNCPPPPEPEPEPEEKEKKHEGDENKEGHGDQGADERGDHGGDEKKPKNPGHGGIPPGQAKLKGEEG